MKCTKKLQQQISNQKSDEKVNLMIIYLRLIQNYLIYSTLTSPPWSNGEVILRLKWHKVVGPAKVVGDYVNLSQLQFVVVPLNKQTSPLCTKISHLM